MEYVKYNPTYRYFKSIVGAVPQQTEFTIRLQLHTIVNPRSVTIVVYNSVGVVQRRQMDYECVTGSYANYVVNLSIDNKGLYYYYFVMDGVQYEHFIGIGNDRQAQLFYDNVNAWQLSVYSKQYVTPTWLNKGVMYQIMVDRFCNVGKVTPTEDKVMCKWGTAPRYCDEDGVVRNRDFYGGNLQGVISKLHYLSRLNVKTIYLNPIFTAYSNHKYDTEDYEQIDSMFGTQQDFETLCQQAQQLGIKVILDGVFNHVGASSKYFNKDGKYGNGGAYNDKKSKYRGWFNFNSDNSYESWWGFETLPRINAQSTSAQEYFAGKDGIIPRWLNAGASGYRLDVVDEIADCMLDKIVSSAKQTKDDCAIIGEVWEDASNKVDYGVLRHYLDGSQLDSVMNYPLMNAIIQFVRYGNEQVLSNTVFDIVNNYPLFIRNNLMNILGTHDTRRVLTALAGLELPNADKQQLAGITLTESQYEQGCHLLQLSAVLQYTLFGFPCVFYGDEVGVQGYRDPFCRLCYPWDNQNEQLLDFYTKLGQVRDISVFCDGDFEQLVAINGVYAFSRFDNLSRAIVAVNRGQYNYVLHFEGNYKQMFSNKIFDSYYDLQPNDFVILVKQ